MIIRNYLNPNTLMFVAMATFSSLLIITGGSYAMTIATKEVRAIFAKKVPQDFRMYRAVLHNNKQVIAFKNYNSDTKYVCTDENNKKINNAENMYKQLKKIYKKRAHDIKKHRSEDIFV